LRKRKVCGAKVAPQGAAAGADRRSVIRIALAKG